MRRSNNRKLFLRIVLILFLIIPATTIFAQCPLLYDGQIIPSTAPYWLACSGLDYSLIVRSPDNIGSWTIDWGDGSAIENGINLIPPATITHFYPSTVDSFIVQFTETASGCIINGVLIMEEPTSASIQIPFGGLTSACAPATLGFINSSTNTSPTTIFTWNFGDGSPLLVFDYNNSGDTVQHQYQKGTVNCETLVTLEAENYCNTDQGGPSAATYQPIRIWDLDDAAIDASYTLLCYPDTSVSFENVTDRNCLFQGNTFQRQEYWNFGDQWGLGYDSIINWTPWPPTFPKTIDYPAPVRPVSYQVMMIDSNYCGQDTAYQTITIVNPPTAGLTVLEDTVCIEESAIFTNTSTGGGNSFSWNFGDGTGWTTTGMGSMSHAFLSQGDYQISLVADITGATPGCSDMATIAVNVLSSPVADFNIAANDGCDTMSTSFSNVSINSVTWDWDFDNGITSTAQNPGTQFYNAPGVYTVSLSVTGANGCPNNISKTVEVHASPAVSFATANVCENSSATFTDASTAGSDPLINWQWNFGDGNTSNSQNPTNNYSTAATYDVALTVSSAFCSDRDTVQVMVEPNPIADFTADLVVGCTPLLVNFTNNSTGATSYSWNFGNGQTSVSTNPSHNFINYGSTDTIYTVKLVAYTAFGCTDTFMLNISVYADVVADFTNDAVVGCAPMIVTFANNSVNGFNYQWDFGDGSTTTTASPVHNYQNTTMFIENYNVELIAISSNGCRDTATDNITVYPQLNITFSAFPDSGCSPLLVAFPPAVGAVIWEWDFGDGVTSNLQTPNHVYDNTTTNNQIFTIQLIATSPFGCKDTSTNTVKIFPKPTANISLPLAEGCHPFLATINNSSIGATNYFWDYGDGNTSTVNSGAHVHTFYNTSSNTINYNIELIVETTDGCKDTSAVIATVYPEVEAEFFRSDTVGCSPLNVNFVEQTSGANQFFWNFDNGNTAVTSSSKSTFLNFGLVDINYNIQLIATSNLGCSDTANHTIVVHPKPLAKFNVDVSEGCQPLGVNITDNSILGAIYNWNMGDGTTTDTTVNFGHEYVNTGNFPITNKIDLIIVSTDGCSDTTTKSVEVYPVVNAKFFVDTVGCSPLDATFINGSTNTSIYDWEFGDNAIDTVAVPTHTFVNNTMIDVNYQVQLIAQSNFGCTDTSVQQVLVHPSPIANFEPTPSTQLYPSTTVVIDNTTNDGNWFYNWNFGDGNTSSLKDPAAHIFSTWGEYTISLTVNSEYCEDSTEKIITIIPPVPIPEFVGANSGCRPVTISFVNNSMYGNTYYWEFGDGSSSAEKNPLHTYYDEGTYTVKLTVIGDGGDSSLLQNDTVNVYENASAYFSLNPSEIVIPSEAVEFYNLSGNSDRYVWDFGDGETSTEQNPKHYYTKEGYYSIRLIANNENNCPDTLVLTDAAYASAAGIITFANAFTPNVTGGNGGAYDPFQYSNDVFFPVHDGVVEYHLSVFNRWGELIFESFDVNIGWDGYYKNELCQQDVYVWKAQGKYVNGKTFSTMGDVTLIK